MFDTPSSQSQSRNLIGQPTLGILRIIGYGILVMGALNIADIILPPDIMNPVWEMEAAGALVDGVPIPLLGLMLVFFGEDSLRKPWENILLRLLSWACLLCAILFLLLLPLMVSHTIRINEQVISQGSSQLQLQMEQLAEVEQQLSQASDDEIAAFLEAEGVAPQEAGGDARSALLDRLTEIKTETEAETTAVMSGRRKAIMKNVVKWGIGSLVSSFIFLWIWMLTVWSRSKAARNRLNRNKVSPSDWSKLGL
ncbi:MAG: HpsJ family protein [Cyanobacteria bacterium P01_F01_bin.4]